MEVRIRVGRCNDELMDECANCGQVPRKMLTARTLAETEDQNTARFYL